MSELVVYYSRTKKNRELANYISERLNISSDEIIDTSSRKGYWGFFVGGFLTITRANVAIKDRKIDPIDYDRIILCSPIWAGSLPPATRTYLRINKNRIRDIVFISLSGMGKDNKLINNDIKLTYGKKASATLLLSELEFEKGIWKEKVDEFLGKLT